MAFSHEDYTVAWICALPLEMAAAKSLLDETHSVIPQPQADYNAYTLGQLAGHNVVVACLPSGVYGTTSAASLLSHMLRTFPCLKFGLMVGIGGGVPSGDVDIRLGDVVVSLPTATSGGVIQYDYGKTLQCGRLQRVGTLNKPPQCLLTAISQLKSNDIMGEEWSEGPILEILQKSPSMQQDFSRPDEDWLFDSSYSHQGQGGDCSACDQCHLIRRSPRSTTMPFVHYGLIASGNQVMKDAKTRDAIAKETGIICFEMEAAGLMDQLPSLVIRGICDYADSHKCKEWQGHAALTAGVYAKQLLTLVSVARKSRKKERKDLTEVKKACLNKLFVTDPLEDKNELKRRRGDRAPGTCSWIMETDEIQTWLKGNIDDSSNLLWLYGNPGTGKSTIAITLAEELPRQRCFAEKGNLFVYFFCDSGAESRRTCTAIVRCLLSQLVTQSPELIKFILPKYEERGERLLQSFDALWTILREIGTDPSAGGVYCLIDALDECESNSQSIFLNEVCRAAKDKSRSCALNFLITSRPYPEIERYLRPFSSKDLSSYPNVRGDLQIFINNKVGELSERNVYSEKLRVEMSKLLEEKAESTFLWVGIACGELEAVRSRDALKMLQRIPQGLHAIYQDLLDTALRHDEDDNRAVLQMLSFVSISKTPLKVADLCAACQRYENEEHEDQLRYTQEDIEMCRLMIVVQDGIVRLLHKSVRDFLVTSERVGIDELKSHAELSNKCIAHILKNVCRLKLGVDTILGFLRYSIIYWPDHAAMAKSKFEVLPDHRDFFQPASKTREIWIEVYNRLTLKLLPRGFTTLHVAARWAIPSLITFGLSIEEKGQTAPMTYFEDHLFRAEDGVTPMEVAAFHDNIHILTLLLQSSGPKVLVAERVWVAGAKSRKEGRAMTMTLVKWHTGKLKISGNMVNAAARNRTCGKEVMRTWLEQHDQIQLTDDAINALCSKFDASTVRLWLENQGRNIQITDDMIRAAIQNWPHGKQVLRTLLSGKPQLTGISDNTIQDMAKSRIYGSYMIDLLLNHLAPNFMLTSNGLNVICRRWHQNVVRTLLYKQVDKVRITKDLIDAVAGNRFNKSAIMKMIIEHQWDQTAFTPELVTLILRNFNWTAVKALLNKKGFVIQITEDMLGDPQTLNSLGLVAAEQGKYEEAEALYQQALKRSEELLGPEHPRTLTIMHNTAFVFKSTNRSTDALKLMAKCAQLRVKHLGPCHPQSILSTNTLAEWGGPSPSESTKSTYIPLNFNWILVGLLSCCLVCLSILLVPPTT